MDLDALFENEALVDTTWSVDLRGEDRAEPVYRWNADAMLKTASIAKIFLLVELAARITDRVIDPRSLLDRRTVPPVGDSGLWQHLATDHLPVVDVARLVGTVSDNLATNVLIRLMGLEPIQERATLMAPGGSTLHDMVRDTRSTGMPATLSEGCAADWTAVLQCLYEGRAQGEAVGATVLDWLSPSADLSMVASAFELDPLSHASGPDQGIRLWNKTGTTAGVRADVGVVMRGNAVWTYAVICNWQVDDEGTRSIVLGTMRDVGAAIRRCL